METIGQRVRSARQKQGFTMKQLHELTGLSTGNISDIENDRYMPSVPSLIPLRSALQCSIDWLLTGEQFFAQKPEQKETCDGRPLDEDEADLIAMYRLIDDASKETVVDMATMFYEKSTGKRASIYSTYTGDKDAQKSGPDDDGAHRGTA